VSLHHLDYLFRPRSVAVVGASPKAGSVGHAVMHNLIEGGYSGRLMPVNPKYDQLLELPCYQRIDKAPETPDLALIAIPIAKVPPLIDACVAAGVKAAVIFSAGGREAGPEGRQLEKAIKEKAYKGGLRIVGPNCMGIVCPQDHLNASFVAHMPPAGGLAFISQSGAICSAMLDLSLKENMGYRYFISIGSMLDVDFGDLIDYVGNDPHVSSVLLYIESLSRYRKFMSAARAVSRMKPIVVLKAGVSEAGAAAAASHTGAMAGSDQVYDAAFKRAGAVRVRSLERFFNCAELLAKQKPPRGRRMTILTNAGGPGVMAADAVAAYGLVLSRLSRDTLDRLHQVLPPHWSGTNPIDILGDADARRYVAALGAIDTQETDGLLIILNPQAMTEPAQVARALVDALGEPPFQVATSWMGGRDVAEGIAILNAAGIPTYATPELAVEAFRYLFDYGRNRKLLQQIPPKIDRRIHFQFDAAKALVESGLKRENGMLTEWESKQVLEAYSIPVNPTRKAASKEDALSLAKEMGFPLAMKIVCPDVVHKSRAGGVRLGLKSEKDVALSYEQMMKKISAGYDKAKIQGVTLQAMCAPVDLELLLGAKKDPDFGPVLLFGWGGVHAETVGDKSIELVPLNRLLARRLMQATRVYRVLCEDEGPARVDRTTLEVLLVCLSQLMVDFPQIEGLDINPLIVSNGRLLAVDARIIVKPSDVPSPHHLSISPYPQQYEDPDVELDGQHLLIRPIKPEDAPLFQALFARLSKTSIYQRFFTPMSSLPHDMLVRFTQIDYDREMALVALDRGAPQERMIGVARIIGRPDGREGEFAVLVDDESQGRGVGAELLSRSLRIVRERGMRKVWGTALTGNTQMIHLARKLGFSVRHTAGGEYEMHIDLRKGQG